MNELQKPVILFDGVCNFCNSGVNFLIRQDKEKNIRFAALQSDAGKRILQEFEIDTATTDSFLLVDNNKVYTYSTAGLKVYNHLPWYWKWTQIFWIVPKFLRDGIYKWVAANRYKWFGRKEECMIPSASVRERFLD
jgi:predicted DCC family thiol-disulfide oxidoreductase YuxK